MGQSWGDPVWGARWSPEMKCCLPREFWGTRVCWPHDDRQAGIRIINENGRPVWDRAWGWRAQRWPSGPREGAGAEHSMGQGCCLVWEPLAMREGCRHRQVSQRQTVWHEQSTSWRRLWVQVAENLPSTESCDLGVRNPPEGGWAPRLGKLSSRRGLVVGT